METQELNNLPHVEACLPEIINFLLNNDGGFLSLCDRKELTEFKYLRGSRLHIPLTFTNDKCSECDISIEFKNYDENLSDSEGNLWAVSSFKCKINYPSYGPELVVQVEKRLQLLQFVVELAKSFEAKFGETSKLLLFTAHERKTRAQIDSLKEHIQNMKLLRLAVDQENITKLDFQTEAKFDCLIASSETFSVHDKKRIYRVNFSKDSKEDVFMTVKRTK